MITTRYFRKPFLMASLIGLSMLASCGGGGDDEAGAATAFSVSPDEFTFTANHFQCVRIDNAVTISVIGGTAPYRVTVHNPQWVTVDQTIVPKGGSFVVSYTGTNGVCFDPATITVTDELGRVATVTLVSEIVEAE